MARSRRPTPHRHATRKADTRPQLRVVEDRDPLPEVVSSLAGVLIDAVAKARTPLQAEQVLCDQIGVLASQLPEDADAAQRDEVLIAMVSDIIDGARERGGEGALALLRVCAQLGPEPVRRRADLVAGGLAAAGVADRPWAARLGRPTLLRAWRSGDVYGSQSSLGVHFDERGREHLVMVLVDHVLGGGVKDVWVATGADCARVYSAMAGRYAHDSEAFLEDLDAARAARLLREALAADPCPEQPDQVEDVGRYLVLLSSRTEHLAALAGLPPAAEDVEADVALPDAPAAHIVLRLRVTSTSGASSSHSSSSQVLEIPATWTLHEVHEELARAFALDTDEAYRFEHLAPDALRPTVFDRARSRRVRFERLVAGPGRLRYRLEGAPARELRIDVLRVLDRVLDVTEPSRIG